MHLEYNKYHVVPWSDMSGGPSLHAALLHLYLYLCLYLELLLVIAGSPTQGRISLL